MSTTLDLQNPSNNIITVGNDIQLSYTQMNAPKTPTVLKQHDAWSGNISVGGDINLTGDPNTANIIRFTSNNHNSYFYGGNDGSSISIGCWDGNNGNAIWRYQDTTQTLALWCNGGLNNLKDLVVDSGTTDGWEYIKLANGLYICSKRMSLSFAIQTAQGSIFYGDTPQINYPITFKTAPNVNANGCGTSATNAWYSVINDTTTGCKLRGWRGSSASSASYGVTVTVIGRWQ